MAGLAGGDATMDIENLECEALRPAADGRAGSAREADLVSGEEVDRKARVLLR
jgi:hypothetical protein